MEAVEPSSQRTKDNEEGGVHVEFLADVEVAQSTNAQQEGHETTNDPWSTILAEYLTGSFQIAV